MDNSNLLDLFKISDYITFDKYLKTDTRNSISSSYSLSESEALKHIKYGINTKDVLTKTLFSEASKYLDDIIIDKISENNPEYIDISEINFPFNGEIIIEVLLNSGRKNAIINPRLATILYDMRSFSSCENNLNRSIIYEIGSVYNIKIFVNSHANWNDPKITLFDDVYANIDSINIIDGCDINLNTTITLEYFYTYKVSNTKLIYLFESKTDPEYIIYKRDKKIDNILND